MSARRRRLAAWPATQASPAAIELHDVHRTFGPVRAVDGIDLHLELGEIAALLGPNGAGKTTTIDMILGLGQPDQGTVSVLGHGAGRSRLAWPRGRGHADGRPAQGPDRAGDGPPDGLALRRTAPRRRGARAGGDHAASPIGSSGKCSGGEQQRLRFALALLPDPALMALDEPTAGMDVEGRRDFWSAIRRDAEQGRTVLFATHYLEEADAYADRIILLRQGRIVADGTAAEVRNLSSGRSVRASLAGADQATLSALPGVRVGRDPRRSRAHPDDGFRRGREVPADRDRRARRGDRGPQPRGCVPRAHLGRAGSGRRRPCDDGSAA